MIFWQEWRHLKMEPENRRRSELIAEASEQIRIKSERLIEKLRGDDVRADTSKDQGSSS